MLLDLIVILLVIILSCLFCMNDKISTSNTRNSQTCCLSHIVIGLTVIVFYKLINYYRINKETNKETNKEPFAVDDSINDFISNTADVIINQDEKTLSDSAIKSYTDTINQLTAQIKKLNDAQAQNNIQSNSPQANTNIDTISLENQQAFQQLQIDYLSKQIKSAQDVINQSTVSNNSTNYKPIKLYSSCVANANGSMTTEQPVKDSFGELQPLESVKNSKSGQQILTASSQNSESNLDIPSILNKLLNKK